MAGAWRWPPSEDRVAFVMPAETASPALPVFLDGRAVTDGESAAFVIGWVDDGGAASDAWTLAGAAPMAGVYNPVDIAALDGGRALVAVGGSTSGALVVEVDLCTQAQSSPLLQCERGVEDLTIDASLEGRLVVAMAVDPGVSCSVLPPGCVLPPGIGFLDTLLLQRGAHRPLLGGPAPQRRGGHRDAPP